MNSRPTQRQAQLKPGVKLYTLVFAAVLSLPGIAGFFSDHEERGLVEKRKLTPWSEVVNTFGEDAFFSNLDSFINDHMGLFLYLNGAYRWSLYHLLGDDPTESVSIADDGFVFLNAHTGGARFSAIKNVCMPSLEPLADIRRSLRQFAAWAEARGARLTLAIVPGKPLLYPERLPATVPADVRNACLAIKPEETLAGLLARKPKVTPYIAYYPLEPARLLRDTEAFYPPGNFHANSMINHQFSKGLLRILGLKPGLAYREGRALETIYNDLISIGFLRRSPAWVHTYPRYGVTGDRQLPGWVTDIYPEVEDSGTFRTERPVAERRAVILSNSFGTFIAPHLAPGFRDTLHININSLQPPAIVPLLQAIEANFDPDEIIYLVHDGGVHTPKLVEIGDQLSSQATPTESERRLPEQL